MSNLIQPIDGAFEELVSAAVASKIEPKPFVKPISKTISKSPKTVQKTNSLVTQISIAMWVADDRPCRWDELTPDEKSEWRIMAKAALKVMRSRMK